MGLRNEGLPGDFTRTVSTNPVSFCLSLTSVSFLHESERLGSFYGEKPIAASGKRVKRDLYRTAKDGPVKK